MSIEEMSKPPREDFQSACEICEHNLDLLMNNHGRCGMKNKRYMQIKEIADCPDFTFLEIAE